MADQWVVRRIAPSGDEDEYIHTFDWTGRIPVNIEWTKVQTMAHRFYDRNQAVRVADYCDGSARPVRIVPRKQNARTELPNGAAPKP